MPKRIQSPSSINTFKQCPRKYFYQYIVKHKTRENIHCIRGNVVHEALERFFDIDIKSIDQNKYKQEMSFFLKNLFQACWSSANNRLKKLGLLDEQLDFYREESMQMLANWITHFFKDIDKELKNNVSLSVAFQKIKPIALEKQYKDSDLGVRGYIDAITQEGEHITLMDYKTSKADEFKPEYLLQLGIYAVLYEKEHGTYVRFWPDTEIMETDNFHFDTLVARLRELAFLNKGLKITIDDERIQDNSHHELYYEGGIISFVEFMNENKNPVHSPIYFEKSKEDIHLEISLQYNPSLTVK